MQIAVISDLHLGPQGLTDGFGHDDANFLRFLRFLEGNFERIILLGDIWETLMGVWPDPLHQLRLAQQNHPEIHRRFQLQKYQYIHGNHDLIAGLTDSAPDQLFLEVEGTRILFKHGHQNETDLYQRQRWLAELGVWLGGWLRRVGMGALYRLIAGWETESSNDEVFQRWAVRQAREETADIIVTGHTHIPGCHEHGSVLYMNSGSCSEGAFNFLSLDTQRGDYRVETSF